MEKLHFHSFDAFRFFAFFKVFIFHASAVVIASEGSTMQWVKDHIAHGGGIGVSFFFVLSGFLITYILTHDKIKHGNIKVKKFFVRRAFRIWPLFYAMVIIAFIIPPDFATKIGYYMNWGGYDPDWRFSFTFLENYKMIIMDNVPRTTPLSVFWSLCIEEHFYIVWMIVFFFLKRKWIPYYLGTTIVLAILARIFEQQIYGTELIGTNDLLTNADYFAISGLIGYFTAVNYKKVESFVLRIPLALRVGYVLALCGVLLYQKAIFSYHNWFMDHFKYTIFSMMFAFLILIFIPQGSRLRIGDNNMLTRLGKISYGLYVYHIIWIHVVYQFFIDYSVPIDNWRAYLLFLFTTFAGTVVTSVLSWRYFEKPLLKYREKIFPSNS